MAAFPLWAQYLLVGGAVAASATHVLASRMPRVAKRCRAWVVMALVDSRSASLQRLGLRLAPPAAQGGACGGCSGCEPR